MTSKVPEDYMKVLQDGAATLPFPLRSTQKTSRKGMKNDIMLYRPQERSKSSAQIDASNVGNEYMALRRKFLLLEEESCSLGSELREAEDEIKSLEDEKLQLLDQLIVLEGLVDPCEVPNQ